MSPVRIIVGAILVALAAWVAVAWVVAQRYRNVVEGHGAVVTQHRSLPRFSRVTARGRYELVIHAGVPQSVAIEAQPNVASLTDTAVSNGTLVVSARERYESPDKTVIQIGVPRLEAISLDGSTDAVVDGVSGASLDLSSKGASDVTGSGTVEKLNVSSMGAGSIHLQHLQTRDASVQTFGAGSTDLSVSDSLNVQIFGAGSVTYHGSPRVQKTISGVGSVSRV